MFNNYVDIPSIFELCREVEKKIIYTYTLTNITAIKIRYSPVYNGHLKVGDIGIIITTFFYDPSDYEEVQDVLSRHVAYTRDSTITMTRRGEFTYIISIKLKDSNPREIESYLKMIMKLFENVKERIMNLIGEDKTMTVAEVAEVFGNSPHYIKRRVKELFPGLVKNGIETRLTETQVTELKKFLTPRTLDMKVQGENAVTEIEKDEIIIKALFYAQEKLQKTQAEKQAHVKALYAKRVQRLP